MSISRVIIDQHLVNHFRKQAQSAYPDEAMVTLWGRIENDTIVVTRLRGVEQEATTDSVQALVEDMVAPAAHLPERYLGSLHSHPDNLDASPSQQDWDNSYATGEFVFGVMNVVKSPKGRFRTELSFWEARPPIDIIHPRTRTAWKKNQASSQLERDLQGTPSPNSAPSSVETVNTSIPALPDIATILQ